MEIQREKIYIKKAGYHMNNSFEKFKEYLDNSKVKKDVMKTGWDDIDEQIAYKGLPTDCLLYLYAKASVGKTYFVTNWIKKILDLNLNRKILFLSLEMSYGNIMDRFLQCVLNDSIWNVREVVKTNDDYVIGKLEQIKYFDRVNICDGLWDLDKLYKEVEEYKPDLIFIDHLHKLKCQHQDIFQKTTQISGSLFDLKKRFNTRIVCLVQLKREGKSRDGNSHAGTRLPLLEDSKGSGAIEEDGDMVFGLARPSINPNVSEINKNVIHGLFIKNRFSSSGFSGIIQWKYDPKTSILRSDYV
jgi:replicative DNA helicase